MCCGCANLDLRPQHIKACPHLQFRQPLECRRRLHGVRSAASIAAPVSLFSFGANNTNACPTNTDPMAVADACEVAADAAGRPYGGTVALPFVPAKCVWLSAGGGFYYNTHPSGAGHVYAQPVCAGAPLVEYRRQHEIWAGVSARAWGHVCVSVHYIANTLHTSAYW